MSSTPPSPRPETSTDPSPTSERVLGAVLVLLGLVLTTWPLLLAPASSVLGTPGLEATDHLWSMWAGLMDGPLVIETGLVGHPEGYTWVLADPVNLLWFSLPYALGGPALGFHAVHLANLVIAGLGAVALGRELLPRHPQAAWLTMLVAVTSSTLAGGLFTGMTEAQTWGWIGLGLAAVHRALRTLAPRDLVMAGIVAGLCAWSGVYTALYAGLAAPPVVLAALLRREPGTRARAGAALAGVSGLALLVAAPVGWAVSTQRSETLPGSTSLTEQVLLDPSLPQNRMLGADLLGVIWPLESVVGANLHAVYLGLPAVLLAAWGVRRAGRSSWPLVLSLVWMVTLGLGIFLQVGGSLPTTDDGRVFLAPAGWLSLWVDTLGRAPRWYRAVAVAGVFLAPLAGTGGAALLARLPRRPRLLAMVGLAGLVLVDALVLSPLDWPRDTYPASPPEGYAQLDRDGPIVEIPSVRFSSVVPGRPATASGGGVRRPDDPIRHPTLLWQTWHHHALGGNPHQAERTRSSRPTSKAVDKLVDAAGKDKLTRVEAARRSLAELGFVYLVHHPTAHPAEITAALRGALGEPVVDTEDLLAWELPTLED